MKLPRIGSTGNSTGCTYAKYIMNGMHGKIVSSTYVAMAGTCVGRSAKDGDETVRNFAPLRFHAQKSKKALSYCMSVKRVRTYPLIHIS
jgi:hypothetical protein